MEWAGIVLGVVGLALLAWVGLTLVRLEARFSSLERAREETGRLLSEELSRGRQESALASVRQEERLDRIRETVEARLKILQTDNNRQLEEMRATVDEKLHATLERRLGAAFESVGAQLEQVHKGLGEMRELAVGVGDLKKVLSNVKTSGTWGEVQLGNLLEQILVPEQYGRNVRTKKTGSENVEFAIRLPGAPGGGSEPVWLPVDSKFPKEYYEKLIAAQERGDAKEVEAAGKALETRIKEEARTVKEKYLDPPQTTDFAVMFLPVEGLYAEVVRRPGLCSVLQGEHRVVVAGPTTFAALLNSLQMGFRTLAIEKRSSEVWQVLGAVKTEFGRFGEILDATHKKLQEASNKIKEASTRSRAIEKKLRAVEGLPAGEAAGLLGTTDDDGAGDSDPA